MPIPTAGTVQWQVNWKHPPGVQPQQDVRHKDAELPHQNSNFAPIIHITFWAATAMNCQWVWEGCSGTRQVTDVWLLACTVISKQHSAGVHHTDRTQAENKQFQGNNCQGWRNNSKTNFSIKKGKKQWQNQDGTKGFSIQKEAEEGIASFREISKWSKKHKKSRRQFHTSGFFSVTYGLL